MNRYFFSALLYIPLLQATGLNQYGASIAESKWNVSQNTALECRLEHNIPGWGKAAFVSRASKNINMDFELKPLRPQAQIQTVTVRSIPPSWRPGVADTSLSKVKFYKQFDGYLSGKAAWSMLDELEGGYTPSFLFRDWYHQNRPITVSVSSIGFRSTYQQFLTCMQGLLPYDFDDISFTILTFEKDSNQLTPYSQRRLNMIGEYLKADPVMDLALVTSHTDSFGSESSNQDLSDKRAAEIKKFFVDLGIDEKRITATGEGEKFNITTNDTERNRQMNRRVVISMQRWYPPEFNINKMKTASR